MFNANNSVLTAFLLLDRQCAWSMKTSLLYTCIGYYADFNPSGATSRNVCLFPDSVLPAKHSQFHIYTNALGCIETLNYDIHTKFINVPNFH